MFMRNGKKKNGNSKVHSHNVYFQHGFGHRVPLRARHFFYKQQIYKQHKNQTNANQNPEAEL